MHTDETFVIVSNMSSKLRIATWNIAGARTIRSLDTFDYEDENTSYFANQIAKVAPDIIFLQESHTNEQKIVAKEIADKLGFNYVYNFEVSPSHIDNDYNLGNAVLSNVELKHYKDVAFPFPSFGYKFANGAPAQKHDKKAHIFRLNELTLVNAQMLPASIFGKSYSADEGLILARQIETLLLDDLATPLIFCGDFNFDSPKDIYPELYSKLELTEALPDVTTRPNKENVKKSPDHILISEGISLIDSRVIAVNADHYLCWADLSVEV